MTTNFANSNTLIRNTNVTQIERSCFEETKKGVKFKPLYSVIIIIIIRLKIQFNISFTIFISDSSLNSTNFDVNNKIIKFYKNFIKFYCDKIFCNFITIAWSINNRIIPIISHWLKCPSRKGD